MYRVHVCTGVDPGAEKILLLYIGLIKHTLGYIACIMRYLNSLATVCSYMYVTVMCGS